jgi:hypothetical protein
LTIFEYLTAALMLVMGLGVTQLLSDVVDAFRRRQTVRLHWIPLTWAAIVFAWQMQFIWAVFELQALLRSWKAWEFLMMLCLALLLFVAGSLVVPRADDEAKSAVEQFRRDGRWTLAILAAFFFLAYFVNIFMFNLEYHDPVDLQDLLLAMALSLTLLARSVTVWATATVLFAVMSAIAIVTLSPSTYE